MEPIHQDKRVSQGQNGDLYFSNVMQEDALTDYSCNARFAFTHTIQQKNPYTLKVLTSKYLCGPAGLEVFDQDLFCTLLFWLDSEKHSPYTCENYFLFMLPLLFSCYTIGETWNLYLFYFICHVGAVSFLQWAQGIIMELWGSKCVCSVLYWLGRQLMDRWTLASVDTF